jgi:hypothetical protein
MRTTAASLLARVHAVLRLVALHAALVASGAAQLGLVADAIVQPPPTALVIGAGMAGLKAARDLVDAGFIVTVLVCFRRVVPRALPISASECTLVFWRSRRRAATASAAAFGLTIRLVSRLSSGRPRCVQCTRRPKLLRLACKSPMAY